VAIGAYPYDVELGCAGLLLKTVSLQSSKIIRADGLWIDNFEDTHLSSSHDLISHIEFIIRKSQADIVFTHSLNETHHDHRAIAASTIEAKRNIPNIIAKLRISNHKYFMIFQTS
jgi:LmbE family N-acetylglucosaminyl deacetylase